MSLTWLHISDLHVRSGDPYDRDVVLGALVRSVTQFREEGRTPDLIFITGDIASSGKKEEYDIATTFIDALVTASGLATRRHVFVIPGNHDVDRRSGIPLARTLDSPEAAGDFFAPDVPKYHLTGKEAAFIAWHDRYFAGVRTWPRDSTCGPIDRIDVHGVSVGILPINSALFSQDDHDFEKLWIGRRCLADALTKLRALDARVNVALIHHPLEWLNGIERPNIKAELVASVDCILRGHLHENEVESVITESGGSLKIAAGATYQTRKYPNRALYADLDGKDLVIFPIRYEDQPREVWTVDPSLFPHERNYQRRFAIPRLADINSNSVVTPAIERVPAGSLPRFKSNISRPNLPFVDREEELSLILGTLTDATKDNVAVLHGIPGVGKSEIAREYARRGRDRYPGGTFLVDASTDTPVDLARIGLDILGISFGANLPIQDQCFQTLLTLGSAPALLIYDNVRSIAGIKKWLPPAGMPCHVLITSVLERWDTGFSLLEVNPLPPTAALDLIGRIAGKNVVARWGQQLVELAGGLPVQIAPMAATLAYEERRGRLATARLTLTPEAIDSFATIYHQLEAPVRLLLHAAAFLNSQRIVSKELERHVLPQTAWSAAEFQRYVDVCLDLHLLDGAAGELRMHQLFASFLRGVAPADDIMPTLARIRDVQRQRLIEVAANLVTTPGNTELASTLMILPTRIDDWQSVGVNIASLDGETIGDGLFSIGRFADAQSWYQRALADEGPSPTNRPARHAELLRSVGSCMRAQRTFDEALEWFRQALRSYDQTPDAKGASMVAHEIGFCLFSKSDFTEAKDWFERSLTSNPKSDGNTRGRALHQIGRCLTGLNQYDTAISWFEQAIEAKQQGDDKGLVDHESLSKSLDALGRCLSRSGRPDEAIDSFKRAIQASRKGDLYGRIDHDSLGRSCYSVATELVSIGKVDEALESYECAVRSLRLGDVFGRVDERKLSKALMDGAGTYRTAGRTDRAAVWEQEAVAIEATSRRVIT